MNAVYNWSDSGNCTRFRDSHGYFLQENRDWHAHESDEDAEQPLSKTEWSRARKRSQVLDNDDLEEDCASDHTHKHVVVQYTFEHIYLFHVSRVYFIEDLRIIYTNFLIM